MIQIQLYNGVKDTKGQSQPIDTIIQTITGPSVGPFISKLRKEIKKLNELKEGGHPESEIKAQENICSEIKTAFPAVTWSGTFEKRNAKNLLEYSGLICIDIDKLDIDRLNQLKESICYNHYTHICFVSPSGNGLKIIVKVNSPAHQHGEAFLQIEKYYLDNYQVQIDKSGKDINRLCFLTSDKNLFYNQESKLFVIAEVVPPTIPAADQKKLSKFTPSEKKILNDATGQSCNDVYESTLQYFPYQDGNRNNFIFKYACNCNRVGITAGECISFAEGFATDKTAAEIKSTVNSAYQHNAHEFGKYKKASHPAKATGTTTDSPAPAKKPDANFWKKHPIEKGNGPERKIVGYRYELDRVDFGDFLYKSGFHLLPTGDEEGFQIVRSVNGIIKPVTPQQIKHFSLNWCKGYNLKEIREMLLKGQTKYFAKNELDSLPFKDVNIKRDTADTTFFYFQNCFVSIHKDGNVKENSYNSIDGVIWESNKIKADFKLVDVQVVDDNGLLLPYDQINCEFAKFIAYASYNPKNEEEKNFEKNIITERFFSFCSAIGFLLDGYKHPSKRLGIFAIDHKIGERFEANGRTGKSMIPQACELLKKVSNISGKTYDPNYQFCDEPITVDTQIINYNDMPRNFDVENIFEKIADNYTVNRRNQGFINFKYTHSPKVYYNTNFTPKGDGDSYTARMHNIEFCDYFNPHHTPYDEFGHGFFDEGWSKEEYLRFYNFMIMCVGIYKNDGLIPYPNPNVENRKLVNDVVPEFIDFMDDVEKNIRLEKIKLLDSFNTVYQQLYNKRLTANTFCSWVKKYCKTKELRFNPHKKGAYDKSNSIEYYTIADSNYKTQQTTLI